MYYSILYNTTLTFYPHSVFVFHMILRINRNYLRKIIKPLIFGRILQVFSVGWALDFCLILLDEFQPSKFYMVPNSYE
jgi:hypothetical protein